LLMDLSLNVAGVISQRLITGLKQSRILAVEVLRHSAYIAEMIRQGHVDQIRPEMERGNQTGVRTFDQSLFELYQAGQISRDEALLNSDSRVDLELKIRLQAQQPGTPIEAGSRMLHDARKGGDLHPAPTWTRRET